MAKRHPTLKKKKTKPGEWVRIYFQTYHIIRFKCPVKKKNHRTHEETEKDGPSKGTKLTTKKSDTEETRGIKLIR